MNRGDAAMGLLQDTWSRLKTWRTISIGPVSIAYRFRRTVRLSKNLPARRQTQIPSQLGGFTSVLGPFGASSFFASPNNAGSAPPVLNGPGVAVIFGVGPGLGFALAQKLVREGIQVALVSRQADHLRSLAFELNTSGSSGRAVIYSCDFSDERGVREVCELVVREIGIPTLIVYSTQQTVGGQAIDITTDVFEDCWRTNCLGGFIVAREAARVMKPKGRGSIVLIGSTSGLIAREGHLSLAVGKFGLRAIAQVMARELWKDGLHVVHVVIDADIEESGKSSEASQDASQSDPTDIAEVIWSIHQQPKTAWASEIDIRPWNERFWEHC